MQPLINDAATAFLRALRIHFVHFTLVLEETRSRGWASATFVGARHEVTFRIEGEGAETAAAVFLEDLDCAEFQPRGHILADIRFLSKERLPDGVRISLEALTVEDG